MENVVDLNERRKPAPRIISGPELAARLQMMVDEYVDAIYEASPMGLIEAYAKDTIEREIRSIPFENAIEIIEKEFPEIACKFRQDTV